VPEGDLTFRYAVGTFELTVSAFQWLVITGEDLARFQGLATVTGQTGQYPFLIEARDLDKTGGKDRVVIKIWAPGADPTTAQPLYGASGDVTGQVTIHKK
jgi:hypothetical protein